MTRVLIIGGYGTFGARLTELLASVGGLSIEVGGRNLDKASALITRLQPITDENTHLSPLRVDRARPLAAQIDTPPDILIDAVGPFQAYGETAMSALRYAKSVGAHYIDLSDDPAFCAVIRDHAKDAPGVVATGWSTYSALTGAVHHALGEGSPLRAGIVPSPRLPMGRAVIKSVASYAGEPIPNGHGLTETMKARIAPPGTLAMRTLLFANVATPDSVLIDAGAVGYVAPQPQILHRLLIVLSRLRKRRLIPSLSLIAPIMHRVQAALKIGEPRGGLFVMAGDRRWDLIGEGETGPYVPVIPAAALTQAIHKGEAFARGYLKPGRAFPLSRLTPWLEQIGIQYGERIEAGPLYEIALGEALDTLPEPIARTHRGGRFSGQAEVVRGRNPLSRLIANLFGLPPAGAHPVEVNLQIDGTREIWDRRYSGKLMRSVHKLGRDALHPLVMEHFGPIAAHLAVSRDKDQMIITPVGWSLFGLSMPRWLGPTGEAYEALDSEGRFTFFVDIRAPFLGRLVQYQGWLTPDE